jgi:hypothetical protein
MLKRLKIFLCLISLVALVGTWGCKKGTFDINDSNPNQPTVVDPKFLLSAALKNTATIVRGGDSDPIELYMGYWAVSGDYIPVTQTLTYQTNTDYGADNWNSGYLVMKNLRQMETIADSNQQYYVALGKIMEGFIAERLVDQYNDIPFTQALNGGFTNFPKFDKALDVYTDIVGKLDSAIAVINNTNPNSEAPGAYDVLFNQGDAAATADEMAEWVQFANTIKLKIALNLSKSSSGASLIQTALSGLTTASFLGAGQDASINPAYSNSSEAQQSPFYYDMGFSTSGAVQNNESYYRACSYFVQYLYQLNDTIRLNQIFAPNSQTPGVVLGRPFGSNVSVNQDNQHISGMGPGLLQGPSSPAAILPATESLFMQAEAVQDGLLTGDVNALYTTAVEESFRLLLDPNYQADADAYIAGSSSQLVNPAVSSNMLQTIIFQEWIAVSGFDPLDSWNNWRRLGIPTDLPVSQFAGNTATHVPYRFLYPTSEYSYNTTNVDAEGTINNLTSKIFWMP